MDKPNSTARQYRVTFASQPDWDGAFATVISWVLTIALGVGLGEIARLLIWGHA